MGSARPLRIKALVFVGSMFATALGVEGVLRIFFGFHQAYSVEMWKYGRNHKRMVPDGRSHEHIPGTSSSVMGKPVRIDRWGYRGPDRDPDFSRRRILALGDSITFGFGVAEEEAWPAILEREIPGVQVWNAGIGNYNTAQELASLSSHVERLKPTEVVLGFFINDFEPIQRGPSNPIAQGCLTLALISQIWWGFGDPVLGDFAACYRRAYEEGWTEWTKAASEGIAYLSRKGIPLEVVLIPELHSLGSDRFDDIYKRVETFFQERGVRVCDAKTRFPASKTGGREFWAARDDAHPNAEGHRFIARAVREAFHP